MLEGLAVWALLIYLLRLVGMPWNKFTQAFAYLGGAAWLLFVWVGLLNYTPMDMSGGSVVQSPHIQLRPDSTTIRGAIEKIHIQPNQRVTEGQLIYELEAEPYEIALKKSQSALDSARVQKELAQEDIELTQSNLAEAKAQVEVIQHQLASASSDLDYKRRTNQRFLEQNAAIAGTVPERELDKQQTEVDLAQSRYLELKSRLKQAEVEVTQAQLTVEKAELTYQARQVDEENARQTLAQSQWDLEHTRVIAPADGYVTNFLIREGQYVGVAPRIHMYTDEKYVLMRVNHQALRNIQVGNSAEFATPIYPGKVFSAQVEGIIEATGESQGSLISSEPGVRQTTGANANNKYHFVRLKIDEPDGYDIPVGAVGLAWISGEKPISFLAFLDVVRGIILRMKSQIYFFYSI